MKTNNSGDLNKRTHLHKDREPYEIIFADAKDEKIQLGFKKQVQLNARMARWFFDHTINQLIWSDGIFEILELNPQKTKADYYTFIEVIHPEDRHIRIQVNEELKSTTKPIEISYRLKFKDERVKWISEICNTDTDHQGNPLRSYGTIQDITKYKIREENFKKKEESINSLIEHFPYAVALYQNNRFSLINKAWRKTFGLSNDFNSSGLTIEDFLADDSKKIFEKKLKAVIHGEYEETFECQYHKYNSNSFEAETTLIPILFQGRSTIQIIVHDLSKLRETERNLQGIKNQFDYLTQNLSAFLWQIDLAGNIQKVSSTFTNILGYQEDEVINRNISRFLTLDSYAIALRALMTQKTRLEKIRKRSGKKILEAIAKNGLKKWIEITALPVFNNERQIIGFSGLCRDITERIQTEHLLRKNEARLNQLIATKDKFFSIIAHDLRVPFNGILGLLDLFQNEFDEIDESEKKKYLKLIEENASNTLNLLESLLEWAKTQTGKHSFHPVRLNLNQVIKSVEETLSPALNLKNLTLITRIPTNLEVYADGMMLTAILQNLLSNSIKYSYPEGTIEIIAEHHPDELEIAVCDTGIGMDEDTLKKLFRLGENISTRGTANEKGSGLGLILCEDFVEMHNGKIWAESKPGNGSKFIFTIPYRLL